MPEARIERYRPYREPRDPELARALRPDRRLEGADGTLPEPDGWRWLRVRGHAPGHLLLFHPDSRHLLLAALRHLAATGRARRETAEGVERYSA